YMLFRIIKNWDKYIYGYIAGSMLLFLITFTLGTSVGGSINWVKIGNFTFQPAEATKIFFVFFIASYYKLRLNSEEIFVPWEHKAISSTNDGVSDSVLREQEHQDYKSGVFNPHSGKQDHRDNKSLDGFTPDSEETKISSKEDTSPGNSANPVSRPDNGHTVSDFSQTDILTKPEAPNYIELIKSKQIIKNKYAFLTIIYLHLFLLLAQRELGMTVLFYTIFISIFYIYEEDYKLLLYNIGAMGIILVLSYFTLAHVRVRLTTWTDPWNQITGKGYQIVQSLFAITAGGFFGTGLGLGNPDYIPVVHTDFIFSAICEEMGLFGGMAVVLLYFILVYRGFKIALTIKDTFKKIVALGITLIYGYQTFIIVGGVIKLIPLTGVTLPFISYGGSSLISAFIAFGILQALSGPEVKGKV
ncbi:MAG TPA: FtsW/RodA/SpoVE family cell cycle protein, partial [Clostridia bacterium]|nr:FtsW/RodA/SpoVE family cell cycle protein [Clostridia bacterium]